jgi:hypothetical protein
LVNLEILADLADLHASFASQNFAYLSCGFLKKFLKTLVKKNKIGEYLDLSKPSSAFTILFGLTARNSELLL